MSSYELECAECGSVKVRSQKQDTIFCNNCLETNDCDVKNKVQEYTVVIEVDGKIDHNGRTIHVSGVTGRKAYGQTEDIAKQKAIEDFRNNPDYNTDISVNKNKFPSGRYLDDWEYNSTSARAIDAIPSDELRPISVKWRDRGITYCKWESGI